MIPPLTRGSNTRYEVPAPHCIEEVRLPDGAVILVRRHGNPDGPRLLMSHGIGLAIDLYYPYWSFLLDEFDLMLFDLRSHGANPPGDSAGHTMPSLSRDVEAVGRRVDRIFGVRPRAGVFHSASCLAAALSPSLGTSFSALVCFEPPFGNSAIAHRILESACHQAALRTRMRVARFPSEQRFIDLMNAQPAMQRLLPDVTRLMAKTTLRKTAGSGCELRCSPSFEARILDSLPAFARMVDPDSFPLPVKVIGADPRLKSYFMPPCDLTGAKSVEFEFLSGTTHLAQLEQPEECALRTVDVLSRIGFCRR